MFKKLLKKDNRQQSRQKADGFCKVQFTNKTGSHEEGVAILDLSRKGMSFSLKAQPFDIGSDLTLVFIEKYTLKAKVTSQHVYYTSPAKDPNQAVYRFSVQFHEELSEQAVKDIHEATKIKAA